MARSPGVSVLTRVEAILRNPAVYRLAELIPKPISGGRGRRRHYPDYMLIVYEALLSVYESARQVEAELSHRVVWKFMRKIVKEMFPDDPLMHLPARPMRRHHYTYARNRYLTDPTVLEAIAALHREIAAAQARGLGLLDPEGPGSWTHPHLSRMLHADGKVVTPLYRAKPGQEKVDRKTGEIRVLRSEPDAGLHFEGGKEDAAWGTKFVLVAARSEDERGRMILDVEWVEKPGGEAKTAMTCFERLAPLVPGVQGIVYDTALRGIHHQRILREFGWIPVNKTQNRIADPKGPRRKGSRGVPKDVHIDTRRVTLADGSTKSVSLYARGGAVGLGELSDSGEVIFVPLRRVRTHRRRDKSGLYRWYSDFRLPPTYGGGVVAVRLHADEHDAARRLNRTENVRVIAPTDPDFDALYARRADSESINRGLEDTLWINRAHSVGHARQHLNLIGYALMVNSVALFSHRQRAPALRAA